MTPLHVELADGWRKVQPRPIGRNLVWEAGHRLWMSDTDFQQPICIGKVGQVDTPNLVHGGSLYRYACQIQHHQKDFSQIVAVEPDSQTVSTFRKLRVNQWIPWMLEALPQRRAFVGLLATHVPGRKLEIKHQLAFLPWDDDRTIPVNLCEDSFNPLAISPLREEILFHGAKGLQRVQINGKCLQRLDHLDFISGKGAAYHPTEPLLIIGGNGIHLHHLNSGLTEILVDIGVMPAWSTDGKGIWFFSCSSELCYYDRKNKVGLPLVTLPDLQFKETKYARPVIQTTDGRYLACMLTRKRRFRGQEVAVMKKQQRKAETWQHRPDFKFDHCFCVADLHRREVWTVEQYGRNLCWLE